MRKTVSQRIFAVDDDKEIVRLERADFQVLVANDGKTALHAIRRDGPDLVVMDLMLPDRDGWEITRFIRSGSTLKSIPIVMLTAGVEDMDKVVGLELRADDCVTKPFLVGWALTLSGG